MERFDPLRVAAAFRAHGVDYVLVGGVATAAHGAPMDIDDIDVLLPPDDDNVSRVGLALMELGAEAVSSEDEHRSTFETSAGRLDLIEISDGFEGVAARAVRTDLGRGVLAPVASLEDLAHLKRLSGRLVDAARLTTIAAEDEAPAETGAAPVSEYDDLSAPHEASGKIMRALERVDDFLTDLDSRGLPGRRDRTARTRRSRS
ncbi:MAG: hypothetical protein WD096_04455 [Actinomycetota bacterium]